MEEDAKARVQKEIKVAKDMDGEHVYIDVVKTGWVKLNKREVVALVKFGESREDISKKLNISLKNVETIIKLGTIKKEKRS